MITSSNFNLVVTIACLLLAGACNEPYVKQPLAAEPDPSVTGLNAAHVASIQEAVGVEGNELVFAVTSDVHTNYGTLRSVLDHMAADTSIRFILVCGDITDKGTLNEMKEYLKEMERIGIPFVTAIGNREHTRTGRITFEEIFGSRNSQFVAGGVRFVLFDNVVNESELPMDLQWLRTTLAAPHDGPTLVAMHIQPSDRSQLTPEHLAQLDSIMAETKPDHVFMGHNHSYEVGEFAQGTPFTTVSWPEAGEYVKVRVKNGKVQIELIRLQQTQQEVPTENQDQITAPAPSSPQ